MDKSFACLCSCKSWRTAVCHAAGTDIDQAGTQFAEDKIPEGPLMLDYMQQMEHDSKFEDSPVSEAGEVFGEYTPFSFITFAEDQENWCTHECSRVINAPMEQVREFFDEWNNIPAAFDLIDTVCMLSHGMAYVITAADALPPGQANSESKRNLMHFNAAIFTFI